MQKPKILQCRPRIRSTGPVIPELATPEVEVAPIILEASAGVDGKVGKEVHSDQVCRAPAVVKAAAIIGMVSTEDQVRQDQAGIDVIQTGALTQ